MEIGEKIRRMMEYRGYSQTKLAKRAQISQSGLSTIINGGASPSATTLSAIAKGLDCSVSELMGETPPGIVRINHNAVPIIGEIACGSPITAEENIEGYTDLPENIRADFALRCKGDSMQPTFLDGDLVLIRQQPEVESGQIAAVNIDGETTLKHVYKQDNGLLLTADNANFRPIYIPADSDREIVIHGLAIGYTRLFD